MGIALIISGNERLSQELGIMLREEGYRRITTVSSGGEARRVISSVTPELAVIDTPLSDEYGSGLAEMIYEYSSAGMIYLCRRDMLDETAESVAQYGACAVSKDIGIQAVRQAVKRLRETNGMMYGHHKENMSLLTKIEEIRLISRAKCTLMQYLKFTEPQAHKYIEKQAMNNRRTRKEVARKILADYER